ncbi:DUF397 domain-containing protein [Streptomyces sp. SID13726]|uniref:DUF397 domain-containing protein n=1 Tax=Streptomyces sp. SID13726 TaxID=2706058 RepID=UPI0013B8396E|nr:DUF397 domain-containing protein [Streptomyces sp. SID13726]NEB04781.1 DUF397 domain-containing protein [Streptomyces sp. SID13726]
MTAPSTHQWFKSSYSGGSGTECVECARDEAGVLIRDSKQEHGPVVTIGVPAWRSFAESLSQTRARLRRAPTASA